MAYLTELDPNARLSALSILGYVHDNVHLSVLSMSEYVHYIVHLPMLNVSEYIHDNVIYRQDRVDMDLELNTYQCALEPGSTRVASRQLRRL